MSAVSTYTPYWWKRTFGASLEDDRAPSSCEVGGDVWIGAGANIVTGVKVGHGAVLGAGAVVVKDVPPYAVVGGVPARIIRYRFDEELRERLLALAWWNWPRELITQAVPLLHSALSGDVLESLEDLSEGLRGKC